MSDVLPVIMLKEVQKGNPNFNFLLFNSYLALTS